MIGELRYVERNFEVNLKRVETDQVSIEDFFESLQNHIQRLLIFEDRIYVAQQPHIEYANISKACDEHYHKLNIFEFFRMTL